MTARQHRRGHLSLERLESFVAAAECGAITAAARRLGWSQPTVTQHLKRLEAQLERRLLLRGSRGLRLTAEGLRLLPLARRVLALNAQALAVDHQASMRLGAASNIGIYLLPQLLTELRRRGEALPQISIAANPEIARRLLAGELDVALMEWWADRPGFASRIWREEPLVAILPPHHPLVRRDSVSLAALRRESLLGGEAGSGTGRLLRGAIGADSPLEVAMNLGSTEAVKRAVAAGLGVSLVPRLSVAEHLAGEARALAVRPLDPPLHKPLYLIWSRSFPDSGRLLEFLVGGGSQ